MDSCQQLNNRFRQLFRAYRNVYVACSKCPHYNDRVRLSHLSAHLMKSHGLSCRYACSFCSARFEWSRGDIGRNATIARHRITCLQRCLEKNGFEEFRGMSSSDASVDSPPLPTDPDHRPLSTCEWKAFLRREKKLCKTLEMCYERIDVLDKQHDIDSNIIHRMTTQLSEADEQLDEMSTQYSAVREENRVLTERLTDCQKKLLNVSVQAL